LEERALRLVLEWFVLNIPCQRFDTSSKVWTWGIVVSQNVPTVCAGTAVGLGVVSAAANVLGSLGLSAKNA
jgi:hypothetical protein